MSEISIKINDKLFPVDLSTLRPDTTLNMFIREHAKLTATKFMCLEGGCGSCIVTIRGKHPVTGKVKTWAVNSCLIFLNSCIEWEIITCEGIGNRLIGYHPIQKRMAEKNATQCGFCSPGFVMNIYSLMKSKEFKLTMEEIENSFGGNLCRCTGYRPILDAMKSFASDSITQLPIECSDIEDLSIRTCTNSGKTCMGKCKSSLQDITYDDGTMWHWPKNLEDLFAKLAKINPNEEYMLVSGNTAHGVYRRSVTIKYFIDINGIADLKRYSYNVTNQILSLGANLTLSEVMDILKDAAVQPGFEYCHQLRQHFDKIANIPVRNTGTLAGNISIKKMHPEFTSDVFINFEALDAQVIIAQEASKRMKLSLAEYLRSKMPKTVITAFELPAIPKDKSIFKSYKIMPRAQNAKAIVNAAFLLKLDLSTGIVSQARLCFGGIRNDFVHATAVEKYLANQCFYNKDVVAKIFYILSNILQPTEVLPQTSPEYRRMLACGLMLKFLLESAPANVVNPEYRSGGPVLQRNLSSGLQIFATQEKNYPITQPIQKIEGLIQCSGEAVFSNDIFTPDNSVYCCFVGGTVVGANIEQIISTKALSMPGVIAFYTAEDIPGLNSYVVPELGYVTEEIFSSEVVQFYNQPLGLIVAESYNAAHLAASKVIVVYSSANEQIAATLQDALANKEMDRIRSCKTSTDDDVTLSGTADLKGKGIFEMGLQYHFAMEPHTCIAVPLEQGLQIWASTQSIDHTQSAIAKMLNIKLADVQLKVRRLGGAYGCKFTGTNRVACAAALAAFKLNRPVRFVETIESMMNCVGKRWACLSDYEFHVKANGKIVGLRNTFYEDAGCTLNQNFIDIFTYPSARNCYDFTADNYKLHGSAVLTDAPSSTFCRAPGTLEGIAMIENIMEHIAFETNMDPADVRMVNMDPENKMKTLLPQFLASREYKLRREEIKNFNSKNRWIKRGLGLSIMQFGLSYFASYPATVAIYHTDGSVVISHGGIEMGQGMNTKIAQVAAFCLRIPMENIKIEGSNSINGANAFVTAASVSSESVCYAVRKACNVLNERLKPIKESLKPNATWIEIVQTAWTKSVNLICSEAFQPGDMNSYNAYGIALTEVQVDMLTGNLIVQCVDILEDCGESLSPYIDVGQVEGAFIMALGYWLTEQLVYDRETGKLQTDRTWLYTPPGAQDIPVKFRIELLQGSANAGGFMRSKASGEPPCCLAISVIFAIQDALQSARTDAGLPRVWVSLGAPTTPETIVLNAGHDIGHFSLK